MFNQKKIFRVLQLITLLQKKPAKSIRFISNFLECSERTAYRYLDLFKQLGFQLEKDEHNKFKIETETIIDENSFTNEEASFLIEIIKTVGKNSVLHDSILKKIYLKSETSNQAKFLFKAHLSKLIEKLKIAIDEQKQVVLKQYHSVNSNLISDRLVEPIKFTENYNAICAYEVSSSITKYFNLERIVDIEILDLKQNNHDKHVIEETDVFGFTERNGIKFYIDLEMTLRAYILMKEFNSSLDQYFTYIPKSNLYSLKVSVNNPKPIIGWLRVLNEDIKIIGSEEFKKYYCSINQNN